MQIGGFMGQILNFNYQVLNSFINKYIMKLKLIIGTLFAVGLAFQGCSQDDDSVDINKDLGQQGGEATVVLSGASDGGKTLNETLHYPMSIGVRLWEPVDNVLVFNADFSEDASVSNNIVSFSINYNTVSKVAEVQYFGSDFEKNIDSKTILVVADRYSLDPNDPGLPQDTATISNFNYNVETSVVSGKITYLTDKHPLPNYQNLHTTTVDFTADVKLIVQ